MRKFDKKMQALQWPAHFFCYVTVKLPTLIYFTFVQFKMQEYRNVSPFRARPGEHFRMRDSCVLQDEISGIQHRLPAAAALPFSETVKLKCRK